MLSLNSSLKNINAKFLYSYLKCEDPRKKSCGIDNYIHTKNIMKIDMHGLLFLYGIWIVFVMFSQPWRIPVPLKWEMALMNFPTLIFHLKFIQW